MSDESPAKRTRSPLNALKLINALRAEKGLPKIGAKPATVKLSKEAKEELFKKIWVETYPSSITEQHYELNEQNVKVALVQFERRVREIQGEKAPYTGKPRGRKPKAD